jgi:predicted nucleic acid-binding protein
MAVADYLLDKSALARIGVAAVAARLRPLVAAGRTATCGMVELELLFSARNGPDHERIRAGLRAHEWLATEDEDFIAAIDVQAQLARSGHHRAVPLPDLLIAAVAARHGVTVLHYDADFEPIAAITGQAVEWVVPAGSLEEPATQVP